MLSPNGQSLLHESLQKGVIHPRLHYETARQAGKWKRVHEVHSPAARQEEVQAIYTQAFQAVSQQISSPRIPVISLGCGGGTKDILLFHELGEKSIHYLPCDISAELAMDAMAAAQAFPNVQQTTPVVCDLTDPKALLDVLALLPAEHPRLFLFLGILPGMPPNDALSCLQTLVRGIDQLIVSANLLPTMGSSAGWAHILPQYDNSETRDWLLTLFDEIGLPRDCGELKFHITPSPTHPEIPRIEASFHFSRATQVEFDEETYRFAANDHLLLFFSHRYTLQTLSPFFKSLNLPQPLSWLDPSGEEGVFLSPPPFAS